MPEQSKKIDKGKKLRARWVVDPEQDKKYMDRLRYEESLPDDGICPWTGEPHGFVQ